MDLINSGEPDCVPLDERLKRLPRKQLKFWVENFPLNNSLTNYCNIFIKYGSILSLPDGLTENMYNGWAMTSNTNIISDERYTGYVVNSYNSMINDILNIFGMSIKYKLIPKLNYLLTNINKYKLQGKSIVDIQVAIWKLLKQQIPDNISYC